MDSKTTINTDTLPQIVELELIEQGIEFPFPASPPVVCSTLGENLHVLTMDSAHQIVQRTAFDTSGRAIGPATMLPLRWVEGIKACDASLIVMGTGHEGEGPVIMGMDEQGSVRWQTDVSITGTLALWPRLVCQDGRIQLIGVTEGEYFSLWSAEVQAGSCRPIESLRLDDMTVDLDVVATEGGLTIARVYGDPIRLELLRIAEGRFVQRSAVMDAIQPVSSTIATIAGRYAVLWISRLDQVLCLQWFDENLCPLGLAEKIVTPAAPARLRCARLIQGAPGFFAIGYQTVTIGDGGDMQDDDGTAAIQEPVQSFEQFVAAYDWKSHTTGTFRRVVEPGITYDAGDWIGDTLLLIHGINMAKLSVYRAVRKKR